MLILLGQVLARGRYPTRSKEASESTPELGVPTGAAHPHSRKMIYEGSARGRARWRRPEAAPEGSRFSRVSERVVESAW